MPRYLAFDLGTESGRAFAETLHDGVISIEEIHHFPNRPVQAAATLYWNVLGLYQQILEVLGMYAQKHGDTVDGINHVIRKSVDLVEYDPENVDFWIERYHCYESLPSRIGRTR